MAAAVAAAAAAVAAAVAMAVEGAAAVVLGVQGRHRMDISVEAVAAVGLEHP
jgi:hypothetical protein